MWKNRGGECEKAYGVGQVAPVAPNKTRRACQERQGGVGRT